jgi:hypothetical protein
MDKIFFKQLFVVCCFALPLRASCTANSVVYRHDASLPFKDKVLTNGNAEQSRNSFQIKGSSRILNRRRFSDFHHVNNNAIIADAMRKNRYEPAAEMMEVSKTTGKH